MKNCTKSAHAARTALLLFREGLLLFGGDFAELAAAFLDRIQETRTASARAALCCTYTSKRRSRGGGGLHFAQSAAATLLDRV